MGAGSHRLEYNRNRSFFSVIVANGQWNSFTVGICPHNHKLAGHTGFCDPFCFHFHPVNVGSEFFRF